MDDIASFVDRICDPKLRDLYAYWNALRGRRFAPSYAEVDPLQMPAGVLPYVLVAEVLTGCDGPRYRFRLCGTEVEAHFGAAMGGRTVDELAYGPYRDYMLALYGRLVRSRRPLFSVSSYHGRQIQTKRLMLPLSGDGAQVDLVLSGQTFFLPKHGPQRLLSLQDEFGDELQIQP